MSNSGVFAVTPGKDETGAERFFSTHRVATISALVGLLALVLAFLPVPELAALWGWVALVAGALALVALVADPALAVWTRWEVVAADSGLIGRRGGVPARWLVYPAGWRKICLLVSKDSILPGDWDTAKLPLAQGFGYARVEVKPRGRKLLLTFSNGANPLDEDLTLALALEGQKCLLGIDELGKKFWLETHGHSGMIVAGQPGSGKTVALRRIAQSFARVPENELAIFDGKGTSDFADLGGENCAVFSGTPAWNENILPALETLQAEMVRRAETGAVPGRVVVLVDECQGFMAAAASDKPEKEALTRSQAILKDLILRGRSLGFLVILSTQKPGSDTMPTAIRDNCGLRLSGRLRTPEAVKMALGDANPQVLSLEVGQMLVDDAKTQTVVKTALTPD